MESLDVNQDELGQQPLEELVFEQSGVHNLREVTPYITIKGIDKDNYMFRASKLC
jgi:hypothetical protein